MILEQRVTHLEAERQRLKRWAGGAVVLLALVVCLGQAAPRQPSELKAERFVLVDAEGRERGLLAVEDGEPTLALHDAKSNDALWLTVSKVTGKPAFYLLDRDLGTNVELAMTMNGPVLHFNDKSGNRVRLATNELNAPLAAIADAEGKRVFEVSAAK